MNLVKQKEGVIVLIDEIHTPDSSHIFYTEGYQESRIRKESKSNCLRVCTPLVNQNGFQGLEGQQIPDMTEEYIETVSERYIELYEKNPWEKFVKADISNINERESKKCAGLFRE
jgi:phosphoribosylaminoimidazole-succinocarboxamide synthase